MSEHIVYHAVVLQPISDCIGHDEPPMDEDTIGIYSEECLAHDGVKRYKTAQAKDDPELDFEEAGMEFVVRPVVLDIDLIFSQTCPYCKGSGSVEVPHPSGYEEYGTVYAECPRCHGQGVLTNQNQQIGSESRRSREGR